MIDQLLDEKHTLDKYAEIDELQETSKANAQAFQTMNGHSTVINSISRLYTNNLKCKRCSKYHPKCQWKIRGPVCHNCGKGGHMAKECTSKQEAQHKNQHNLSLRQDFKRSRTAKFHDITAEDQEFHIEAEDGTNVGTIDYPMANTIFKNLQVIDSIEKKSVLFKDPIKSR